MISERITKVLTIHLEVAMNVCAKFQVIAIHKATVQAWTKIRMHSCYIG